ncbi:MAG: hypothetical protein U0N59_03335 [Oscillospiraceae bacterium]|jgi:hypothetical protein
MKKVLATILTLVMALGLCSVSWADTALAKGTDGKFHITSADDLKTFAAMVNGGTGFSGDTIVLDKSIELTENPWTPIGNAETKLFKGTFDGNGYTITGLKITSGSYIGLFGYVGEGATIKNVNLLGASVSGESRVGALIGCIVGGATVSNCSVDSASKVVGSGSNTGGLIGEAIGNITVNLDHLTNHAAVSNKADANSRAAGIIAQITRGAIVTISICENRGSITTNLGYAGGIVAAKQGGSEVSFENCSNAGTLAGNYTGRLIAWLVGGNRLSMTNSGDARAAIGAVNISGNEGYTFYFTIDGEEYYIRKQGGAEGSDTKFSALWDVKKTIDRAYMDRIIAFFDYAKSEQGEGGSFAAYPSNRAELFGHAWNTSNHTRMDSMFGAEGWPELLSRYNEAKHDDMKTDDFKVIWEANILYSAPAPAPTPDPTPSTGGYYYYPSTTTNDTTKGSPKTFDAGVGIYAVTAVLSVTGMAWTAKKRGN